MKNATATQTNNEINQAPAIEDADSELTTITLHELDFVGGGGAVVTLG